MGDEAPQRGRSGLRLRWRAEPGEIASAARLETLADGVFAIVMTLLVLELGVPVIVETSNAALTEALAEMWPQFLIYALSFMVLGVYWLIHKMIFDSVVGADPPLIWLNIVFLMAVGLIPFSTALVGEHGDLPITAFAYGINLLLAFAMAWAAWFYATREHRLVDEDLDPVVVRGGNRMGAVYFSVLAAASVLGIFAPLAAFITYAVFIGLIILMTMLGRWEEVMVWAQESDRGSEAPSGGP